MNKHKTLSADQLYRHCSLEPVAFATTDELEVLDSPLGQSRALEAIEFGVDIKQDGFNLFVLGPSGLGKHHLVEQILKQRAGTTSDLFDWCYVDNFDNPQQPRVLKLPAGFGQQLSKDMDELVQDLQTTLPSSIESEEHRMQRQQIEDDYQERTEQVFKNLEQEAQKNGATLLRTPTGYTMAPLGEDGPLDPKDFNKLDKEKRLEIEESIALLQEKLQAVVRSIPLMKREINRKIRALNKDITSITVEQLIAWIEHRYEQYPEVIDYLTKAKNHAIENIEDFLPEDGETPAENIDQHARSFHSLRVNVIVDNTGLTGAPMIFEDNPTYQNLIGRVEYISQMGAMLTHFTLIKAGALHRANGGYLILEARKLLTNTYAWEGLKRVLKSGKVKIASLQEIFSLSSTLSLEPENIPIETKVVLTGEPYLYYLMKQYDPEFSQLFKVCADFSQHADRNDENSLLYARMIATLQRRKQLKPLSQKAVERIIEQASRIAEDSGKLSLHLESINDLLHEADYWAQKAESTTVRLEDIEAAIEKRHKRHNKVDQQMQEQIVRGIKLIDTSDSKVAQINGLSVVQLGDSAFGKPTRITATARLGTGKIIDIEREVDLGGEIHTKGMLILSSYLANRYARNQPLALTASLVFEQSYGNIDGDSATAAELCVLLSAIAQIPINQGLAVTGSMNQFGEIQAIGGVNQKIEGFFDLCSERGLTGGQGVVIPASNQEHLMLRKDIRDAVAQHKFTIYTAHHVEDVLEILSGLSRGEINDSGEYPEGSFNHLILERIGELQQLHNQFGKNAAENSTADKGVTSD